jgi:hypothetical protein
LKNNFFESNICTRYFKKGRPIFENILDIEDKSELERIVRDINIKEPGNRDSENYLNKRIEFEKYLYDEVVRKGLRPKLNHPIYMFLGKKRYYGSKNRPWNNTGWVSINLTEFSNDNVSFTYVDPLQIDKKPKIYLFNELEDMFDKHKDFFKNFLPEVHVWDKHPLDEYLNNNSLDYYGNDLCE